jgi:DNA-directed RNA polymerase subunit RPC12/RpoP
MPEPEFDKPIPCPHCGALLETVQIEKVTVLEWHEAEKCDNIEKGEGPLPDLVDESGFIDNGQGEVTVLCYKCGREIGHSDANDSSGIYPKSDEC